MKRGPTFDDALKAVLLRSGRRDGENAAEVAELTVPSLHPGEILVEMKACGLCGTDVEKLRGNYTASMPVLGHEAVGVIAKVGEGVVDLNEGEGVFPHHHVSCGKCHYCRRGSETMCEEYRRTNLDPGGFADYFRVPERNVARGGVLKIPPRVQFEVASLIEPVACSMRALDKCAASPDETVLVVGGGPVGMIHSILLKKINARVMVSDVNEQRLKFAREAKVGDVLDARKENIVGAVKGLTGERGVDLAVVASGNPRAVVQALKAVRKGGRVLLFGAVVKGSVLEYDLSDIFNSEISIVSSYGATEKETRKALDLIASGAFDFGRLITHRFRLDEFQQAVEASEDGRGMKVILTSDSGRGHS